VWYFCFQSDFNRARAKNSITLSKKEENKKKKSEKQSQHMNYGEYALLSLYLLFLYFSIDGGWWQTSEKINNNFKFF
jgi:hypothetical protein